MNLFLDFTWNCSMIYVLVLYNSGRYWFRSLRAIINWKIWLNRNEIIDLRRFYSIDLLNDRSVWIEIELILIVRFSQNDFIFTLLVALNRFASHHFTQSLTLCLLCSMYVIGKFFASSWIEMFALMNVVWSAMMNLKFRTNECAVRARFSWNVIAFWSGLFHSVWIPHSTYTKFESA